MGIYNNLNSDVVHIQFYIQEWVNSALVMVLVIVGNDVRLRKIPECNDRNDDWGFALFS